MAQVAQTRRRAPGPFMEPAILTLQGVEVAGATDGSHVSLSVAAWLRLGGQVALAAPAPPGAPAAAPAAPPLPARRSPSPSRSRSRGSGSSSQGSPPRARLCPRRAPPPESSPSPSSPSAAAEFEEIPVEPEPPLPPPAHRPPARPAARGPPPAPRLPQAPGRRSTRRSHRAGRGRPRPPGPSSSQDLQPTRHCLHGTRAHPNLRQPFCPDGAFPVPLTRSAPPAPSAFQGSRHPTPPPGGRHSATPRHLLPRPHLCCAPSFQGSAATPLPFEQPDAPFTPPTPLPTGTPGEKKKKGKKKKTKENRGSPLTKTKKNNNIQQTADRASLTP